MNFNVNRHLDRFQIEGHSNYAAMNVMLYALSGQCYEFVHNQFQKVVVPTSQQQFWLLHIFTILCIFHLFSF